MQTTEYYFEPLDYQPQISRNDMLIGPDLITTKKMTRGKSMQTLT